MDQHEMQNVHKVNDYKILRERKLNLVLNLKASWAGQRYNLHDQET